MMTILTLAVFWCTVLAIVIPVTIIVLIISAIHNGKDRRALRRYERRERKERAKFIKNICR